MRKPTILVTDDHNLFRKSLIGIIATFNPDYVLTEASNGVEALEVLEKGTVDVVLLDIQMPGMDGIELLGEIRRKRISVKVIVLSQFDENALIAHAMSLGVNAFLNKTCPPEELDRALQAVLENGFYQSAAAVQGLRLALDPDHVNLNLSVRERQMIGLLKEGKSNKEIAMIQQLAVHTVETYRKALLKKTRCKNVTELISFAYRVGLS
jgi:DNA-binding NarL/FixJ family response regulator